MGPSHTVSEKKTRFRSKIANFPTPCMYLTPAKVASLEFCNGGSAQKTKSHTPARGWKEFDDVAMNPF